MMAVRVRRELRSEGFTLLEMLVVLVVIGLIAAVAVPQVGRLLEGAKTEAARLQLDAVANSLTFYQLDTGSYPSTEQGLKALWEAPDDVTGWSGPYVRKERQLIDPWGHAFVYRAPAADADFALTSLGADGKPGGTGDDADIAHDA